MEQGGGQVKVEGRLSPERGQISHASHVSEQALLMFLCT